LYSLEEYNQIILDRLETENKEKIYQDGLRKKINCSTESQFLSLADVFETLSGYKKADLEAKDCKQLAEIDKYISEFKELIPGYKDVSLMLFPHEDSKAFQYRTKKLQFENRLKYYIDTEIVDAEAKEQTLNILNTHDYSVGTPPVTEAHLNLMNKDTLPLIPKP